MVNVKVHGRRRRRRCQRWAEEAVAYVLKTGHS